MGPPPAPDPTAVPSGYPKEARLRRERDFAAIRARGRRFEGAQVQVRVLATGTGRPRLGLSSPVRYGDAVRRNRFRRVVRAAFRLVADRLGSRDFLVGPRRDLAEPTLRGVAADLAAAAGAPRP